MNATPLIQRLIEMAGCAERGGYVLALDEGGLGDLPEAVEAGGSKFTVCRSETELALRRTVWKADGAPFIALMPRELAQRLPPDLLERSCSGHVHTLSIVDILSVALGVQVSGVEDPELQQLALDHAPQLRQTMAQRTLPTVVDAQLLEELLIEIILEQRIRSASAAGVVAKLLAKGPALEPPVRRLFRRQSPVHLGTQGRILAWSLAEPGRLEALLVHGILLATESDELPLAVWGPLDGALDDAHVGLPSDSLRRSIVQLIEKVLDEMGPAAAPYLKQADSLARQLLAPSLIARSHILPLGFENRAAQIADRAAAGEAIGREEIEWLERHRAVDAYRRELALLAELARLSRYLATEESSASAIDARLRAYQRHGAFADLAAMRMQRCLAATGSFHSEAGAVLDAWRKRRDAENLAFAKSLAEDYPAAIGQDGVVPMHNILRDVARPRIDQSGRPVFVVVLDGCSLAVFNELLWQLAATAGTGIGLELGEDLGAAELPLGISILPSITSHARGALMAGKIPDDPLVEESTWQAEAAKTDKARLNQNDWLESLSTQLFLKGDLADGGASLRAALAADGPRLVVAVYNTVDDLIGSAAGLSVQVRADQIAGLLPALNAAFDAGRSVLLTSDHGHSLHASTDHRVSAGATARFLALGKGEAAPAGFIEIDTHGLGGTDARQAFAWRMSAYRGNQPKVGYHGGCGLEEMAVPLAWLERGGLPAEEPAWWFDAGPAARERFPEHVELDAVVEEPGPAGDLVAAALPEVPAKPVEPKPVAVPRRLPAEIPEGIAQGLDDNEQRALALLAGNRTLTETELARSLEMRPARVRGFMTKLHHTLQAEGQPLFEVERLGSGEHQYSWRGGG